MQNDFTAKYNGKCSILSISLLHQRDANAKAVSDWSKKTFKSFGVMFSASSAHLGPICLKISGLPRPEFEGLVPLSKKELCE